jgi:hypothetical protein
MLHFRGSSESLFKLSRGRQAVSWETVKKVRNIKFVKRSLFAMLRFSVIYKLSVEVLHIISVSCTLGGNFLQHN